MPSGGSAVYGLLFIHPPQQHRPVDIDDDSRVSLEEVAMVRALPWAGHPSPDDLGRALCAGDASTSRCDTPEQHGFRIVEAHLAKSVSGVFMSGSREVNTKVVVSRFLLALVEVLDALLELVVVGAQALVHLPDQVIPCILDVSVVVAHNIIELPLVHRRDVVEVTLPNDMSFERT